MDMAARKAIIIGLFDSFPAANSVGIETVTAIAEATEGYCLEAVEKAAARFIAGEVERDNHRMPPSAAEIIPVVRMLHAAIEVRDADPDDDPSPRLVTYPIGAKPPPGTVPLGPIKVDFGHGSIDMSRMSPAEKDRVLRDGGVRRIEPGRVVPRLQGMR
jgi:hypothetical protein